MAGVDCNPTGGAIWHCNIHRLPHKKGKFITLIIHRYPLHFSHFQIYQRQPLHGKMLDSCLTKLEESGVRTDGGANEEAIRERLAFIGIEGPEIPSGMLEVQDGGGAQVQDGAGALVGGKPIAGGEIGARSGNRGSTVEVWEEIELGELGEKRVEGEEEKKKRKWWKLKGEKGGEGEEENKKKWWKVKRLKKGEKED